MKKIVNMGRVLFMVALMLSIIAMPVSAIGTNNALKFDGVDDTVNVSPFPTSNGDITFMAWVKLDTPVVNTFACWGYNSNNLLFRAWGGSVELIFNNQLLDSTSLPMGSWNHVAFTKSGVNCKIYVNGILCNSGPLGSSDRTFTELYLGSRGADQHFLDGEMDDVGIWNRVLSAEQIKMYSAAPLTGSEEGLQVCYNFDKGVAGGNNTGLTTLVDITNNGNNGTLNNFELSGEDSNWFRSPYTSVANVKGIVEGTVYTMTQAAATDEAAVKAEIESKIETMDLDGVTTTVTKVLYIPAVAGDVVTPSGINGTYTFTVDLSKGSATDITKTLTMKVIATEFDVEAANTASVANVKGIVEGTAYTMTQAEATDEAAVKAEIESKIETMDLDGVTTTVTKVLYTPAIVGDVVTPSGINGTYTFTVDLSKGSAIDTTKILTMKVIATEFDVEAANTASVANVKGIVEGTAYTMTQAAATDEAAVKAEIEAKIETMDLYGVTTTVTKVLYTPAVVGDVVTPAGINGTYTFTVDLSKGSATDTTKTLTMKVTATAYVKNSSGHSSHTKPVPTPAPSGADILVNGSTINVGSIVESIDGGKTVSTVSVDEKMLNQKIATEGNNAVVTININTVSDVKSGELNGQMVKNMEDKQATIEVRTGTATYTLPAKQINIYAISEQIGKNVKLEDIKVAIEIGKTPQEKVKVVENSAKKGDFTIVVPSVDFNVKCTYSGNTIDINKFNSYVERIVAIPEGADSTKITTGVIVDADGTVRHVPTKIIIIDGKYYAKINSLTNSTYTIVWHLLEFEDVDKHWAKEAINDMGSRMVISGVGNDMYEPNRDITRAEFAAILVNGLGLKPGTGKNPFADVNSTDWYSKHVETAYDYGIISGYGNGKFAPMDKITREEAMVMIAKAMKITGIKVEWKADKAEKLLAEFDDSEKSSSWANESIATCVEVGIVSGKGGKILAPEDEITRAEVAVIVRRLLQKTGLI